jgi:Holliday junction DNA helicase RuvB
MKLIGNRDIKSQLDVERFSSYIEDRPLPHTLFKGAAGCGKTSTAREIARQSNSLFLNVAAETIKTRDDVLRIIEQFDRETGYDRYGNRIKEIKITYPIVFIDEIHRLPDTGQEHLGIAMEEWRVPLDEKQVKAKPSDQFGMKVKDRSRWCPRFTLMGATTNDGLLTKPFRDRFKLSFSFNTYSMDDSTQIVKVHAERLNVIVDDGGAYEIARRGRGVPRIIVSLLERCKAFAVSMGHQVIDADVAKVTFGLIKVDNSGLRETDIRILTTLYDAKDPIGIDNLSIIVNESKQAISESIEPYLIQRGLITRTSRGRILTEKGKEYLIEHGYIEDDENEDWVDIPNNYIRRF